jgi:hypothetical protein
MTPSTFKTVAGGDTAIGGLGNDTCTIDIGDATSG